jgi:hypothetical protein
VVPPSALEISSQFGCENGVRCEVFDAWRDAVQYQRQ